MTKAQYIAIAAQSAAILINLGTAYAYAYVKKDWGLALAFAAYSFACIGYIISIVKA